MSMFADIIREARFFLRQRTAVAILAAAAALSTFAIWSGVAEVGRQNAEIASLKEADARERAAALAGQSDYGGAAYYTFHLTYDPPSELAFAALGQRDVFPWKHRIRMLALEGQIYETDAGNPELARFGPFDFAFVVGVLAPLLVILLVHDLRASERAAGRHDLLAATAASGERLWRTRALVRAILLFAAVTVPFIAASAGAGVSAGLTAATLAVAAAHIAVWTILSAAAARAPLSAPTIATALAGLWVAVTFVVPAAGELAIAQAVPSPKGGDIVLTQREAVNDAWDLPKETTMAAFVARHPQWAETATIEKPFEWKWYYAFQQVGDQTAEDLSEAYRAAVERRTAAANALAFASPPALTARVMTRLARTDARAALDYERRVREFHARLRAFYYPLLFTDAAYDPGAFDRLPAFGAQTSDDDPNAAQVAEAAR